MSLFERIILFCTIIAILSASFIEGNTIVTLYHGGSVVGINLTSEQGRPTNAYLGIPYSQPPLGDLRFKDPLPFGPWTGERLATNISDQCLQPGANGSEDCLYLNVYVPQLNDTEAKEPLPVMVWIHGGAFVVGSTQGFPSDYLMDRNVVLVTMNYRLNILGFLSTETLECPGNFGLKDQLVALQWVHKNIGAFGGDHESITIFGQSAGSVSVSYHLISQKSNSLFHEAITESATYNSYWGLAFKGVPAQRAKKLAQIVGCDVRSENWSTIMQCLRTKPATDINAALSKFNVNLSTYSKCF